MKVVSYGLVLTRVIEQMEAVKPYTVKAGTERGWRNAVRGQGPTKQRFTVTSQNDTDITALL